ncbi:uncharacterized protein K444DRAFT_628668 [Hyaloscypha bicolor E]|uniref:Uncharacterized protein n=1 Tax=Hyaloscypha bicolor E TaxID=1095630 RepID=A0A2J6TF47_9HELO|nr:uncharacterized protein K444DRAFT_628668 [Hyaloscypha bicolor E]PMD61651.1 hypothetical protein K444DRAFT_628668 [Hyaloscypha bicolor E]
MGNNVVTEATLEIPISRELQGIQTAFYALPNVNAILPQVTSSRNLPINLDPESPEGSPVVADISSLEPLHDDTGLLCHSMHRDTPRRQRTCTQVRRRPASSGPEQAPAPRKRRTNVRGASPGSIIRRSSVLESLPQGSHYIFISAAEVPVSGISQETMERLFNR